MSEFARLRPDICRLQFYTCRAEEEGDSYLDHVVGLARLKIFPLPAMDIHTSRGMITLTDVSQSQFDGLIASKRDETPPPVPLRDYDMA